MTFDPYPFKLDGLEISPPRYSIEEITGTNLMAGRRDAGVEVGWRHGTVASDSYHTERVQPLLISIHDVDQNGVWSHPAGGFGHLEANKDALFAVLGKRGLIDVRRTVPSLEEDESDGGPIQLQNHAQVRRAVDLSGTSRKWQAFVELVFPWPFWRELPQITRAGNTSHSFQLGGSAPVADMVLTFPAAGTATFGSQIIEVGTACTVDVGKREVYVSSVLDMSALVDASHDFWMEWPAQTTINLTSSVNLGVAYYTAWH